MFLSETSKTIASGTFVVVDGIEIAGGFPLFAPQGTMAAPSYSFAADTGSGLYMTALDGVGMAVTGTNSLTLAVDSNVTLAGSPPSNYGGGKGVAFLPQVATAPTSAPNAGTGGLMYADATSLFFTNNLGTNVNVCRLSGDLDGPGSSTDNMAILFSGTSGKIIENSTLFVDVGGANAVVSLDPSNTPGAPRYSFLSDPTSGMYTPGANTLGFSTAGVQRLQVNVGSVVSSVPARLVTGSVAAPALQFTGDGGLYSNEGSVVFANDGLNCMSLEPNSNLTIGGGVAQNYAGGQGVTLLKQVSTAPTGATTGGISVYSEGTALRAMTTSGTVLDLTACVEGAASSTDNALVRFADSDGDLVKNTVTVVADTGEIASPDGSSALPTYAFAGEVGSGLYRVSADVLGVSTSGVGRVQISDTAFTSTVRLLVTDGSSGAPSIAIATDTDTGLFLNGGSVSLTGDGDVGLSVSPGRNISLVGDVAPSYGGGEGVVFINQAVVDPTTNPTDGGLLYIPSGDVETLAFRDTTGAVTILNSVLEGPDSASDRAIARWDGVTGRVIQNSNVFVTATGLVRGVDGSVGDPSYGFAGSTDSGMFWSGSTLGLSLNGAQVLSVAAASVSVTQNASIQVGTVGVPALTFSSDTDTGVYQPSADTVSFVGGGGAGMAVTLVSGGSNSSVTLCSDTLGYGGTTEGERVVKIEDVGVAPSGTASGGGRVYVSGTTPRFHDDSGGDVDLLNIVSGPVSSTANAMLRWDGTSGQLVQNSGVLVAESGTYIQTPVATAAAPTFSFTSATGDGLYFPSPTSIAVSTSGVERMLVSTTAATVNGALQADVGVEIGGGTGASYSLSGANFISDVQTASGTFGWRNSVASIMDTSGLDLSFPNNMVFTEGAETLTIGHDGTKYDFNSDGTTPQDLVLSVGGTDIVEFNSVDDVVVTGVLSTTGRFSVTNNGYAYTTLGGNRGLQYVNVNGFALGIASAPAIGFTTDHNITWGGDAASATGGGSGVVYLRNNSGLPSSTPVSGVVLHQDEGTLRGLGVLTAAPLRSLADAGRVRAKITLTTSISASTSTDVDGLTWTSVDENDVSGTTLGRLTTPADCFVGLTVTAEWASDSTGYRRVSVMRRTTGPVYTRLNGVTTTAVNGAITGQTVYFFGSISASADELTVQVEQTSSGALSVDLSMSFIRYETNVAV